MTAPIRIGDLLRDKGYIGKDGEHTTEAGRQVIADCLRELRYDSVQP